MSVKLVPKNKLEKTTREYSTCAWLLLDCKTCNANLAVYRKVGTTGKLNRLYYNRIIAPEGLSPHKGLMCGECKTSLTEPTTHIEEDMAIYTLFSDKIEETTITEEEVVKILGSNTSTNSTEQS